MTAARASGSELRIGVVGAGTIAGAHSAALVNVAHLFRTLALRPRLAAVADVNGSLARSLAERWGYDRVAGDWRELVEADDVDLVLACLPPAANREVVLGAAAAGKHVVCEKPLGVSAADAADLLGAVRAAGVFHGLAAGYRWSPAVRAIRALIDAGELGEVRSLRASFMLDYAADPDVPLLWRFRKELAGGGIAIDTGYHLVDCARFLVGEIEAIQGLSATFIADRPLPGRRRGRQPRGRVGRAGLPDDGPGRRRGRRGGARELRRWRVRGVSRRAGSRSGVGSPFGSRSSGRAARPTGTSSDRTSSRSACPATPGRSGSGGSSSTRPIRARPSSSSRDRWNLDRLARLRGAPCGPSS